MNVMPSGAYSSQQARQEKIPSGYKKYAVNNYTPEQEGIFSSAQGLINPQSFTSRLAMGDQSAFGEMEAPALRQFGELQAGLASKFSGMGMGGRKSSGFQNTATAAAQDFASQLQSKRMELRNQAIQDMMGMSERLLNQRPQDVGLTEKQQKDNSGWYGLAGAGLGAAGGFLAGGPAGALAGGKLGYKVGSGFK